tara:strand:+ start:1283 stop:1642 length:360 start_codon:yes stop_codon:yes gene_type:complete
MDKKCAIYKTANFIGKRWTLLILLDIHKGQNNTKRYSQIKRSLQSITPKILSMRLKELEKEKLITKKIDSSQMPIKSEYSLTRSGLDFIKIIKDMKKWSLKWKYNNKICESVDCSECEL